MKFFQMALKKHFYKAGCRAEVSVNLKGWMSIEEVRISTTRTTCCRIAITHDFTDHFIGMISIQQTGCKINFPSFTPSCSFITTNFKSSVGSLCQFRSSQRRYLTSRVQSK